MSTTTNNVPAGGSSTIRDSTGASDADCRQPPNGPDRRPAERDSTSGLQRVSLNERAKKYADVCAKCGSAVPPATPVVLHDRGRGGRGRVQNVTSCLRCAGAWLESRPRTQELCPHCGRTVYRRNRGRLFCCDRCAWLAASATRRARTASQREKTCELCGRLFTATRVDARTCSAACRQRDHRRRVGNTGTAGLDWRAGHA